MKYIRLILIVVCSCLSVSVSAGMAGGTGVLLDLSSNQPIPEAKIRLECQRNLWHGSQKVKDIIVTTGADGKFTYTSPELSDCDFAYVHAEKPGYVETDTVDIRYASTDYEHLPTKFYMTPVADARMQHLRFLSALAGGARPSKEYEYSGIYELFFASKNIAETAPEKQYVHEQYCHRLLALYDSLTESQKTLLKNEYVEYHWNNKMKSGKLDHDKEVVLYCKSQ